MAATTKTLLQAVGRLLNAVETKRYLAISPDKEKVFEDYPLLYNSDVTDRNVSIICVLPLYTLTPKIWDEPIDSTTAKQDLVDEGKTAKVVTKAATLNRLVTALTAEKNHDTPFMNTFMLTYQSFTTPALLLEKLLQRYHTPPTVHDDTRIPVQLRVIHIIKIWIERSFVDIDDRVVARIREFINEQLPADDHLDLSKSLGGELQRRMAERSARIHFIQSIPITDMSVPEGQLSPVALFLELNESEIARQLTLIEFKIFESIEPAELLNQSWNKNELRHRAPNVLDMISRGNRLSFWVASMILWLETVEERCKMIEKFITIADHVYRLNNFSTLMGILAGLNMSSVTRLKKTFNEIPPTHMQNFVNLEKLMSFQSSYKTYRQALHKCTPPLLPYIGTFLSDLTFIEDGNPDKIGNLINWQKQEMVHKVIVEIQNYQIQNYKFPIVEPIHTFLTELPSMTDKELYDLSLSLEPRDPNQKNNKNMYGTLTKKKANKGM